MKWFVLIVFVICCYLDVHSQNAYAVKAKAKTVSNDIQQLTKEEKFIKDNFPFIHMADWKAGMRFMVEPDNLGLEATLNLKPYIGKSKFYSEQPLQKDFEWKIFTFVKLEERQVQCKDKPCPRTFVVLDCEGKLFEYEYFDNIEEMRTSNIFTNIDYLVYLDEVDKAKELLLNKTLYILRPLWLEERKGEHGVYGFHQKFVPVKIVNVGLGSSSGPCKMVFKTDSGDEYFLDVRFSETNIGSRVLGVDFSKGFSFDDPHKLYPNISNQIWKLIQESKIQIGMTKEECELTWGKPKDINTDINNETKRDQWVYSSERYLYFKDNRLISIQE
ncbi:MAG TPA: hypothetical protein DCL77_14705 [Prolixibacteraceae bacterium]|nr:hypothetical protein [Prolixibacteraceae bacterium]